MVGVRDEIRLSSRVGCVLALLAMVALLAACAAPAGSSGQATGSQSGSQVAATSAPAATQAPAAAAEVSFSKDVMPIFQQSCVKCHGGSDGTKGDLSLKTFDDMMKGGKDGAVINAGDASGSMLVKQIQNGKMPKRGQKLPQAQIDSIAQWVNAGAKNN